MRLCAAFFYAIASRAMAMAMANDIYFLTFTCIIAYITCYIYKGEGYLENAVQHVSVCVCVVPADKVFFPWRHFLLLLYKAASSSEQLYSPRVTCHCRQTRFSFSLIRREL